MTTEIPVDVEVLRDEIRRTYTDVSTEQDKEFIFPTGRAWAQELAYPEPELGRVPDATVESFAGVANHWLLGRIDPGAVVVDLGCGAGTDLLIAAQMTGPEGRVIGIDMTSSMLERAAGSAAEMGLGNVELHESLIETLPVEDGSVDVVISNGVIDLVPDKDAVFEEIDRVLRPGRTASGRRRDHPHRVVRGRAQADRPLDRLNCRSSPGGRACAPAGPAGLHRHRARRDRRHIRPFCFRGHATEGGEVRGDGRGDSSDQAGMSHAPA